MSASTDLTEAKTDTALAVSDEVAAVLAQQEEEFDDDLFQTPILKIGQPLTREVQNDEAEAGEFINTLTGDGLGDKLEFIVAYYQKGRFAADRKSGRAFVAFGETIPEAWSDLVGDEFVGTPFSEYPDAEETYKERVNRGDIEWEKGPLVSTTHNFTGLAVVPGVGDEPDQLQPVRLSLQRTNMPSVRKIRSLQKAALRGRPFWDVAFELGTQRKEFNQGIAYLLTVRLGRNTTAEEKAMATELAVAVAAGRVSDNQAKEGADTPAEPAARGGLAV